MGPNRYTSFLIAFFFTFKLCIATSTLHQIPINTTQIYSLNMNSSLIFQIPAFASSKIGTFNVILASAQDQSSESIRVERVACNNEQLLPFERVAYTSELSSISFIANASESNYFQIDSVLDLQDDDILNLTIQVKFSPIETVLGIGAPLVIELPENVEKEFVYVNENFDAEAILVTLKNQEKGILNNNSTSRLQFNHIGANCIESISEISWLCYLSVGKGFQKFVFYHPDKTGSYEISISEIESQKINADMEILVDHHYITGFGSLMKVNLPAAGILKVRARTFGTKHLPIIGAPYLAALFELLSHRNTNFDFGDLTVKNEHSNTSFYYFIPEQKSLESFVLSSYLIRQTVLQVGEKEAFYISPDFSEYQYIDLRLEAQEFSQNYEITIRAEGHGVLMNLYLDTKSYDGEYSLFPDESHCKIKASPIAVRTKELVLPFVASSLDRSAFLSIHVQEKGFFSVEARKVPTITIWQSICIVVSLNCVIVYLFSCFAKIYLIKKSAEVDDFAFWPTESTRERTEPGAQANTSGIEIHIPIESIVDDNEDKNTKKIVPMIKKLKKHSKIEQARRKEEPIEKELDKEGGSGDQIIEINEEETCDICYESKKTVTFEPCSHSCACAFCALIIIKTSAKCPLCRGDIKEVQLSLEIQSKQKNNKE